MNHLKILFNDILKNNGITQEKWESLVHAYVAEHSGMYATIIQFQQQRKIITAVKKDILSWSSFEEAMKIIAQEYGPVQVKVTVSLGTGVSCSNNYIVDRK